MVLTELHSEAEHAALRYTEALTRAADTDPDAAFQRSHDALAEHFTPDEMLEIVAVVVNRPREPSTVGRSRRLSRSTTPCAFRGDDPASARATRRSD
jgi:hypothetical protein